MANITLSTLATIAAPVSPVKEKRDASKFDGHDAYGARIGTMSNAMNNVLYNEAGELRSPASIAALSGASIARVKGHLRWLRERNRI